MIQSNEPTRAPSDRLETGSEKAPNRRPALRFDARDVLAGRVDDTTVAQAVEGRR